ncbi:MAG TPA: sigma-54 dependent transcriptional regulator [Candidatus Acidoferrum sp.]|nr:sigma-54 dependent transcriptional regulator [Candidatus Acidoferrum sp.]
MTEQSLRPAVLELDGSNAQPLSVRAKALVFHDPVSQAILDYIERIAPSEAPVLINGETGTGKELVARHIHLLSGRKGPFLAINCGAINDHLSESELFGHEAGAFTGATGRREGWFEAANGGTLFLDEIGDLPANLQVKLLRVLQEREVVRVGSRKAIPVDVRLLAGTNVDLDHAVEAGHFRRDLLYRINIAQVLLPPLRERPGDILPLVDHFVKVYSKRMQLQSPAITDAAKQLLGGYQWPGNIRELENVVHFALLVSGDREIRPEHLKITGGWNARPPVSQAALSAVEPVSMPAPLLRIANELRILFEGPQGRHFDDLEKLVVGEAFRFSGLNQVHTANLLGISRNVVRTLLKRHGFIAAEESDAA